MVERRHLLGTLAAALLAAGALAPAAEAAYPERPVTMIVPWAAGGGTDTVARMFASVLEEQLGQPVNVVNRTGGAGVVGHSAIANAEPDGYTIGMATMEITIFEALGLAPITPDSFTPIARIAEIPSGVQVAADAPYESAGDLLNAISEADPGTYNASGCSVGCAWHLALAGWLKAEGIEPDRVGWIPSQGGAPALQDLIAGGIELSTVSIVESKSVIDAGEVKSLAVMHPERLDAFPDVPTLDEALGTDWTMSTWFALVGPAGLPDEVVQTLTEAARRAHESQAFQEFVDERGYVAVWNEGEEFASFMDQFSSEKGALIDDLGIGQ